jgi:hypothetical protein
MFVGPSDARRARLSKFGFSGVNMPVVTDTLQSDRVRTQEKSGEPDVLGAFDTGPVASEGEVVVVIGLDTK